MRLYPPWADTSVMRARGKEGGVEMGNTSLVDVGVLEGWDSPLESENDDDDGDVDGDGEGGGREGEGNGGGGWEAEFKRLEYFDCILEEGDVLYIPVGWWHYVRGLSVSFSVSFWWN